MGNNAPSAVSPNPKRPAVYAILIFRSPDLQIYPYVRELGLCPSSRYQGLTDLHRSLSFALIASLRVRTRSVFSVDLYEFVLSVSDPMWSYDDLKTNTLTSIVFIRRLCQKRLVIAGVSFARMIRYSVLNGAP